MAATTAQTFLPVDLVFNPHWWHRTAGICFDEGFYLNAERRIQDDVRMRRLLYAHFSDLGLGERDPQPRPVIGSLFVAGGFVIPALLGAEIVFSPDAAPQPKPVSLSMAEIEAYEKPDIHTTWPMNQILANMDALRARYGYVVGDLNTDGLLNAAYHLYGQDLFLDFYAAPRRVRRLLELIGELIVDVALSVRQRSGSCSISVNRMVAHIDSALFLHANCSVQMISPNSYQAMQFPVELRMAQRIQPFGIHHCGDNLHRIAPLYADLPAIFYDVGWGSDVAACREALPGAFFSLRLSPVRMLNCTPEEIAADTERLLLAAGPLEKAGVCCINMDYGTPDENIHAMYAVVERYRMYGG